MYSPATYSLGYSPASTRKTRPVPAWALALVPKPTGKNETVLSGQEQVERDTIPLIKSKIKRTLWHTKKLAPKLKGTTLEETLRNDWNFIFDHIKYVKDAPGTEQVRSPRRLIHDGRGDCDCFVVTLSSLLHNQGIPHKLRIIKQNGASHWSHVYVVVPKPGGGYYTLDPVTHKFDYEPPHSQTKDFTMALEYLDGLADETAAARCKPIGPNALTFYQGPVPLFSDQQKNDAVQPAQVVEDAEVMQAQPAQQKAGFGWWMLLLIGGLIATGADPKKAGLKAASGGLAGTKNKKLKLLQL